MCVCRLTIASNFKDIITAIISNMAKVITVAFGRVRAIGPVSFTLSGNRWITASTF